MTQTPPAAVASDGTQTTLRRTRKTAEYYRDRDGVLWKRLCTGWKKMKEAKHVNKKQCEEFIMVPFKVMEGEFTAEYHVRCLNASTLTASGLAIKIAAEIEENYTLQMLEPEERKILEREAVVLSPIGETLFIAIPQAHW